MDKLVFEYNLHKEEIDIKYIKYLTGINFVVIMLKLSGLPLKTISERMDNIYSNFYRKFTPSSVSSFYQKSRLKLCEIKMYAELFGIEDKINTPTYEFLLNKFNKIISERRNTNNEV